MLQWSPERWSGRIRWVSSGRLLLVVSIQWIVSGGLHTSCFICSGYIGLDCRRISSIATDSLMNFLETSQRFPNISKHFHDGIIKTTLRSAPLKKKKVFATTATTVVRLEFWELSFKLWQRILLANVRLFRDRGENLETQSNNRGASYESSKESHWRTFDPWIQIETNECGRM